MAARTTIRATIHGRVQGVWYRGWTEAEARGLGLDGWVRNLPDGSVEALFVGPAADVADMLNACHSGPSAARVTRIETEELAEVPDISGFGVRR